MSTKRPRQMWPRKLAQSGATRETLLFLGFLGLTVAMTWPWVLHLRDAIRDPGDPYAHAYYLWWGYHQTLHDPLNLFHANIFYPYGYTFAFGENDYGISLIFFPLFALGFLPLTVCSVAAFLSFPFTGYGTFRLARALSGSNAVAWVAGIILAFIPFRFHHLSHLPLVFAGWIPLLFEALILFARQRTWRRASWLGLAFLMNALTCLAWLILTIIPLGLSAILLLMRYRAWRERAFWLRAGATLGAASLLLLFFLLPFRRAAQTHAFVRTPEEVQRYSARPINWLAVEDINKLWKGLGAAGADSEMYLFPGILPPLLALAALLLVPPDAPRQGAKSLRKTILALLDSTAIVSGVVAVLSFGYEHFQLRLPGLTILTASGQQALIILALTLLVRCAIAYPLALGRCFLRGERNLIETLRSGQDSELLGHGLVWGSIGFMGSFGLNFFFHRALYEYVPLFRSMRVAARWAMICYVGLALLSGLGAVRFAQLLSRHWPKPRTTLVCLVLVMAILFEQRVAPLPLIQGRADPDELTQYLKTKKMSGGVVELPAGEGSQLYMLRAADHERPLVNGIGSFVPPIAQEIQSLSVSQPIPDRLLNLLESIPASYLTIHNSLMSPERRLVVEDFLSRGVSSGRLRFIRSFEAGDRNGLRERNDLYAVAKTEPQAQSEGPQPPALSQEASEPQLSGLVANLRDRGFFLCQLYRVSFSRAPRFDEFMADVQMLGHEQAAPEVLEENKRAFLEAWVQRPEFIARFEGMSGEQYVDALLAQAGLTGGQAPRERLVNELRRGTITRAAALRNIIENRTFSEREFNAAIVLMHYFAYLRRDPDQAGYDFWLRNLNRFNDQNSFTEAFAASAERQLELSQP